MKAILALCGTPFGLLLLCVISDASWATVIVMRVVGVVCFVGGMWVWRNLFKRYYEG